MSNPEGELENAVGGRGLEVPGKKAPVALRREQILEAAFEVASCLGLGGLTVRAIATEAQVSHGLVHFHFRRKARLVIALLDWVLAGTLTLESYEGTDNDPRAMNRLRSLLSLEMERLSSEPRRLRLFFEYWAIGTRDPAIGDRINVEMERYRASWRVVAEDVLRSDEKGFARVTADGLAAVAVGLVNGCAVQAMIDPDHFDLEEYLEGVSSLIGSWSVP